MSNYDELIQSLGYVENANDRLEIILIRQDKNVTKRIFFRKSKAEAYYDEIEKCVLTEKSGSDVPEKDAKVINLLKELYS